jgi:hypothetical protein
MSVIMRVVALADGTEFKDEMWVKEYDLNALAGTTSGFLFNSAGVSGATINGRYGGVIILTTTRALALDWPDAAKAMEAWNTVSNQRPRRPDGRPNKPLTALTVEVEPA